MQLTSSFTVPLPVSETWSVVSDLDKIVDALPGFTLSSVDGETFRVAVSLAVGKATRTFEGSGEVARRDEDAHVLELQALGDSGEDDSTAHGTLSITVVDPAVQDAEDAEDDDSDDSEGSGGDSKDDSEDGSPDEDSSSEADSEPDGDDGEGKPSDAANSQASQDEKEGDEDGDDAPEDPGPAPGETSRVELRADVTGTGPKLATALVSSVGSQVLASLASGLQSDLGVPSEEAEEGARRGAPQGTAAVELGRSVSPRVPADSDGALSGPRTTAPVREDGALDLVAAAGPTLQDSYLRPALAFGVLVAVLTGIGRQLNQGRWKPPFLD